LSSLRRMAQLKLHDNPAAAERYHRAAESHHVRLDVPPPLDPKPGLSVVPDVKVAVA